MRVSTPDRIIQLIRENSDIDAGQVTKWLDITYETASKHLRNLVEDDQLERYPKGDPWNYYYRISSKKKPVTPELKTFF
ncbi:MAG: hypothetical protein V1818_00755 [Candidatus Aenigmatarchaeota archaeon]